MNFEIHRYIHKHAFKIIYLACFARVGSIVKSRGVVSTNSTGRQERRLGTGILGFRDHIFNGTIFLRVVGVFSAGGVRAVQGLPRGGTTFTRGFLDSIVHNLLHYFFCHSWCCIKIFNAFHVQNEIGKFHHFGKRRLKSQKNGLLNCKYVLNLVSLYAWASVYKATIQLQFYLNSIYNLR